RFGESEQDRAERLTVIDAQGRRLGELESERNNLHAEVCALRQQLELIEADRAARLGLIHQQARELGEQPQRIRQMDVERTNRLAEIQAQLEQIQAVMAQLRVLQRSFQMVEHTRAYKLLRTLGRWKFLDELHTAPPGAPPASTSQT